MCVYVSVYDKFDFRLWLRIPLFLCKEIQQTLAVPHEEAE
jgi:hypothetical protein